MSDFRLFRLCPVLVLAVHALVSTPALPSESPSPASPSESQLFEGTDGNWRIPRYCGPNALYAFLKLHGQDVSYTDVLNGTAPDENGASMTDLKRCSESLGLHVLVRKMDPTQLQEIQFPAVAHMSGHRLGHFLVALGFDESGGLIVADPTACTVEAMEMNLFKADWSGYMLTRKETLWHSPALYLSAAALVLLIFAMCYKRPSAA